jgi:hypothetical protein
VLNEVERLLCLECSSSLKWTYESSFTMAYMYPVKTGRDDRETTCLTST